MNTRILTIVTALASIAFFVTVYAGIKQGEINEQDRRQNLGTERNRQDGPTSSDAGDGHPQADPRGTGVGGAHVQDNPAIPPQPATQAVHLRGGGDSGVVGADARVFEVTAYCPCEKCCGKFADGITASKKPVTFNGGKFVAADPSLPFGTMVRVPGYNDGKAIPILDRGGAIKGKRLDVFFPTHQAALNWGRQTLIVEIMK